MRRHSCVLYILGVIVIIAGLGTVTWFLTPNTLASIVVTHAHVDYRIIITEDRVSYFILLECGRSSLTRTLGSAMLRVNKKQGHFATPALTVVNPTLVRADIQDEQLFVDLSQAKILFTQP